MIKAPQNAPAGFDWILKLLNWQLEDNVLVVTAQTAAGNSAALTFRSLSPEIWRMTFTPEGVAPPEPSPMMVTQNEPLRPLQVDATELGITVRGPDVTLEIETDPWTMRYVDSSGRVLFRENPDDVDGLGKSNILPLGYIQNEDDVTTVTESFHLRQDERLFGLGEKFTPLNKSGQHIVTWTQDAFGSTSERSHKNIPLLLSTRGYGLFLDTGACITWELGTRSLQSCTITIEDSAFDAYLIRGDTPAKILELYTGLTGRSPIPPKWSFGLWLSSAGTYRDQETITRLMDGLEEHGISADVLHVDTWWMEWQKYCDFRWDRAAFPDVDGFIEEIHARGLRLSLWEHPYVSIESDLFEVGKREGYFLRRPDGEVYVIDYGLSLAPRPDGIVREATRQESWNAPVAIIDMTNPQAYAWFQDLHRPLFQMGVDAFKTDFGEDIPLDAVFSQGETGKTMHNLYPLLYNKAVFDVTQQERGYGLVWSRAGTAGNQRYPVCWSGDPGADFDSLACTIRGGLSIGLSGIPFWSHDIGAFRGMPSANLYVRWAQFGLFCSHSRMHGDSPREPWFFGEEALNIVRRYVDLRYQLFPYLYSAAHEASRTGMPVIRAMPLAFPDDPNTYDKDLQYMLGPDLLVAPVYDEGDSRWVYLPAGNWVDFWTRQIVSGPINIEIDAPLDTLPLFVRGGSIIPMMLPAQRIPEAQIDSLILEIYPGGEGTYRLYEDEGMTAFELRAQDQRKTLSWSGDAERRFTIRFKGEAEPSEIRVHAVETGSSIQFETELLENNTVEVRLLPTKGAKIEIMTSGS